MEENRESRFEQIAQLEDKIRKLPIKLQNAICWAIENLDELKEIGKDSKMTPEEIQSAMKSALEEENYATLLLLHITEFMREFKENEEL